MFWTCKNCQNFQKNSARDPTEYTLRTSVIILSFILSTKKSCVPLSAFFLSRSFQIFWIFDLKFSLSSKIMSKADEYFKFLKDNTSLQRWWFKSEHETLPQSRLLNYWFCRFARFYSFRLNLTAFGSFTIRRDPFDIPSRESFWHHKIYWNVDYVHLVMRALIGESDVIIIWTSPCIGVYLTFMIRLCFDDDSTGYFAWLSFWKWFYIWKMNTTSLNIDRI